MPITTTKDEMEHLTTHVVTGRVSEEEMYRALEGDGEFTPLILWDMSGADVAHVTPEMLRNFVKRAAELGSQRRGGRTAVIAPEDLQFGLARMSEAFAAMEFAPYRFRAFRVRQEAFDWLKSEESG